MADGLKRINAKRFAEISDNMKGKSIAVVGDLMLDRYVWGKVSRISPEAPVPIIALEGESSNLGGAANVAANAGALGLNVSLFGLIGDDSDGKKFIHLVKEQNYSEEGIIVDPNRRTSVKTRVIAKNQHMIRIDRESDHYIDDTYAMRLLGRFGTELSKFNAVILEDYNKGVLSSMVISQILDVCRKGRVLVGVDPKLENFWEYQGATVFKPNLRELETALGKPIHSDEDLKEAGAHVKKKLDVKHLLITAGSKGMTLFTDNKMLEIPTKAHRVHDVSGAGDTVIATIMSTLAAGASITEAATIATYAAGVVIAEVGAVPVNLDDLRRACVGRD